MKPVLVLKNESAVGLVPGSRDVQFTVGAGKHGLRDLAGAAFGRNRKLGTRLAAMGDLAGRGFSAVATAQQAAEQAQSGRGAEAYLSAPAMYRANVPFSLTNNIEDLGPRPQQPQSPASIPLPQSVTPSYQPSNNLLPEGAPAFFSTNQRAGGAQYNPQQNIFPQATLGAMAQQQPTQQFAPAPVTAPTQPVAVQPPVTAPTAPQQPQQGQQPQQQGVGNQFMPPGQPGNTYMPVTNSADPFTHALNYLLKRMG
tara:strand:+ start:4900 stop:5661 length:762 start_codon:yes stop_codon:yes gene_type:complete